MKFQELSNAQKQVVLGILKHKIGEREKILEWLNANRGNREFNEWVQVCSKLPNLRLEQATAQRQKTIEDAQSVFDGSAVVDGSN